MNHGSTALIAASDEGHEAVVKVLIEAGASIDYANQDGSTALMYASCWRAIKGTRQ